MPTAPTLIDDAPAAPNPSDRSTFRTRFHAFINYIKNTLVDGINAANTNVYNNAVEADAAATLAVAAAATANAENFNAATTYAQWAVARSLVDGLAYQRKTAGQAATDPANDADPTTGTWRRVSFALGLGGASASGSVSLVSTSPGMQSITPTAYGQAVSLPDATTLLEGVSERAVYNAGAYPLLVKNYVGAALAFLDPLATGIAGLVDNSTTAGSWSIAGGRPYGIDGVFAATFSSAPGTTPALQAVELDSDRTLLLMSGATSLHAVVYNFADGAAGSPVLVRNAGVTTNVIAGKTATDQVLVVSALTTALEAVVLTVDPADDSIAVGTADTETLAGAIASMGTAATDGTGLVQVGSSWWFGYTRATTVAGIRAITISGTTPTIGAEAATDGTGIVPIIFAVTSSTALVLSQSAGSNIRPRVYSVSGSTLTAGAAAATISASATGFVVQPIGSRWALTYTNTQRYGAIVSVSGTTASASAVQLSSSASASRPCVAVVGNQMIVASDSSGTVSINVLTDTAGTASAGTAITRSGSGSNLAYLGASASELWIAHSVGSGTSMRAVMRVGISGADPVINGVNVVGSASSGNFELPSGNAAYKALTDDTAHLIGSQISVAFGTGAGSDALGFNGAAPFPVPMLPTGSAIVTARQGADKLWRGTYVNGAGGADWAFTRVVAL